jgi:hypothetical protein
MNPRTIGLIRPSTHLLDGGYVDAELLVTAQTTSSSSPVSIRSRPRFRIRVLWLTGDLFLKEGNPHGGS